MEFSYPFEVQKAIKIDKKTDERKVDSKICSKELNKNNESGATGFFPFGVNSFWHGGIHLNEIERELKENTLVKEPVRAIADGKVIAYRIGQNSVVCEKKIDSNSFVLIKHKYKSPNGLTFIFYSLYMHLLPWDSYQNNNHIKPAFFKKPKFRVNTTRDGNGLNLRSEENWERIIAVIPKGVKATKIGESPSKKDWRKKEDYPINRKTGKQVKKWSPHGYKKFSYVDADGNKYIGYAYISHMTSTKKDNNEYRVKVSNDIQNDTTKKGLNIVNMFDKNDVFTVLPNGREIFFNKPDEAILAHQNNTNEYVTWIDSFPEKAKVKVSSDNIEISYEDVPFEFDTIVNTDPNIEKYNIKAGAVVGYCGNYYGKKNVHIEVFASENETINNQQINNNFTAFYENMKNDDLMKKEWNSCYRFGKDSVFYHCKSRVASGKYRKGSVLQVVQRRGTFPYSNTIKVKKIADVDLSKTYFAGWNKYVPGTNNHQLRVQLKKNALYENTLSENESLTKSTITKCPGFPKRSINDFLIIRRETILHPKRNEWVMGYYDGYFKGYIQINLNSIENEFYIDCDELDTACYECNKTGTEYLIKHDLTKYSENPEILFSEDAAELERQKTAPLSKNHDVNGGNVKFDEHKQGNTVWKKLNLKIDRKDAWFKENELKKSKLNFHNHKDFFELVNLPANNQLINNICESPKLIHEIEKNYLEKLKEIKIELERSEIENDRKLIPKIAEEISSQEQRVRTAASKISDSFLNDSKSLNDRRKKKRKILKKCIACCPTEWSNKLYENNKLNILKKYWNFKQSEIDYIIQRLQRFEFWETVSAAGELPTDGENLWFFHPITFVSHMKKLKYGYSDEFKLLIATVYGEAANSTNVAWKAITHVVMNRTKWRRIKSVTDSIYSGFDAATNSDKKGTEHFQLAMGYLNGEKITTITCKKYDEILEKKVWKTWDDSLNKNGKKTVELIIQNIQGIYLKEEDDFTDGATNYYSPWAQSWLHKKYPKDYTRTVPKWALEKEEVVFKNGFKLDRNEDYVNNKSKDDFIFMK